MAMNDEDVNYYGGGEPPPSIGLKQIIDSNVVNPHEASSLQEAQKKRMYGWGPWTTSKGWQQEDSWR